MQDFRNLGIWHKAHALTKEMYRATKNFPREELYGLTSQIRRATVSIPSNIAEGCGRHSNAELARFIQISMGSASEVEYQLLLCHELGYLTEQQYKPLNYKTVELKKMMSSFIKSKRTS